MSLSGLRTLLALGVLSLTACAQQSNLQQIQHEIKALNQDMLILSQQAVALSRQNALNAQSTQGVYLLPDAGAPALLESQIGILKMSLPHISDAPTGTQVSLLIEASPQHQLPAFSGSIEWQSRQDDTDVESENATGQQSFTAPVPFTTPGKTLIVLTLPGVMPDTLRWVRIHDITPITEKSVISED